MSFKIDDSFKPVGDARPFKNHGIAFYARDEEPSRLYFVTTESRGDDNITLNGFIDYEGPLKKARTYVISRYMEDRPVLMQKEGAIAPMTIKRIKNAD